MDSGGLVVLVVLLVVAAVIVLVGGNASLGKVRTRRYGRLHEAAGSVELLRQVIDSGTPVDQTDKQGNTVLHYAYYTGREAAIDNLRAFGADDNLRNNEGLTPPEMADVAATERLLAECAEYLAAHGTWRDPAAARPIYDRLQEHAPRIFNPALVRLMQRYGRRRRLLVLAIKIGMPGSEERLEQVLFAYGDQHMAVDYLNAGSAALRRSAEIWARRNGYQVYYRQGRAGVGWGTF
ncbi:hypothetical protein [Flindersiella endophytica]